jgi:hypothetical protein
MDELVQAHLTQLNLPNISLIPLAEVETAELLAVKPDRSHGEYCWTLTPFTPQFVFDRDKTIQRVTYLDADLFFFDTPKLLLDEFESSGKHVLITEHAYDPKYARFGRAERSGRFCVQFITFRRTEEASRVINWWQDRCVEWCYARVEDGKFGDQKYLDQWPILFNSEVHILVQKNKTLAPWNVAYYASIESISPVFYHFHGFRILSEKQLLLYSGYRVGVTGETLYVDYLCELRVVVNNLNKVGIQLPCLPRKTDFLSRLVIMKHKLLDGEKSTAFYKV